MEKNQPDNARDAGDTGSVSGLGRSLEEEIAAHSSTLTEKIPCTEELGGQQSLGLQNRT